MVDFVDPGAGISEPGEGDDFWRINEYVGSTLLLIPQDEYQTKTEYGDQKVIDCIGGVWDTRQSEFIVTGSCRVFQGVLKKKLRPVMSAKSGLIAVLVKEAAYYDFVNADPTLKKQVGEAWEKLQEAGDTPDDSF
jgi:hypothetical protein